jgi:hypothetical protein
VGFPRVVLTPFIGAYNVHGISHYGRPVEALSKSIPDEGPWHGVVTAGPTMDVFQQLSPLPGGDTALQDLGVALFIDLSLDDEYDLAWRTSHWASVLSTRSVSRMRQSRYGTLQSGKVSNPTDGSSLISMTSGSVGAVERSAPEPKVRDLLLALAPKPEAGGSLLAYSGSS